MRVGVRGGGEERRKQEEREMEGDAVQGEFTEISLA